MTEEEYDSRKKSITKKLDKAFKAVMKGKMSREDYLNIRKEWNQLIEEAQKEDWFKHV